MFAFVFPGQGLQQVGMGKELCEKYPLAKEVFAQADEALGYSISKLCFEGPEDELKLTANAQPAILTVSIATLRVLQQETNLNPIMVAGHSLGEFSALVCAEAMRFEDAVKIVHKRGTFMQEAVPVGEGAMAAVMGVENDVVDALCRDAADDQVLCPANFNGGSQVVIAGHAEAVERAKNLGQERGAVVRTLKVSAPFHCPLMEPAAGKLATELANISISNPAIPVIVNVDASPNLDGAKVADILTQQVTAPVQWETSIKRMVEMGIKEIVEIGCGTKLGAMIRRIDKNIKVSNVETPDHIEDFKARAQDDLQAFAGPIGQWVTNNAGNLISKDGKRVVWARNGKVEDVDEVHWQFNENGTKFRMSGGMHIIWADGTLETLSSEEWEPRFDGAYARKDRTKVISALGEIEEFDMKEWEVTEAGTLKKKDGKRIIWSDGLEWNFNDPKAHGF